MGHGLGFTLVVALTTLIVSWAVSIFVGVYSATHRYTIPDYGITLLQFIGLAVPGFLLALVLMVFAQRTLGMDVGGLFSREYRDAAVEFCEVRRSCWGTCGSPSSSSGHRGRHG